jgi:hypothetical protein
VNPFDRADADARQLLTDAITRSGKSRFEIASEMSKVTGHEITKAMLDAWTAESKPRWRFPFLFVTAFEVAIGARPMTDMLAKRHGLTLIGPEEQLYLRLGRAAYERADLDARMELLKGQIRESK